MDFDAAVPPRATLVPIIRRRAIASIRRTVLDAQVGHPCRRQPVMERSRPHRVDERAGLGSARRARLHLHDGQQSTPEDAARPWRARRVRHADARGHLRPQRAGVQEPDEAAQAAFVDWDAGGGLPVWQDSRRDSNGAVVGYYREADCLLDRVVPGITGDGWAVLERPPRQYTPFRVATAVETSLAGFGLAGKATGLELARADYGRGPGRQRHRQEPGVHHADHDGARPERPAGARAVADRRAAWPRHRRSDTADARSDGAAPARGPADRRHRRTRGPAWRDRERGRDARAGRARGWLHDAAFLLARAHVLPTSARRSR